MPPGAELLASSEQTGIEMYSVGEHTLAIQGHPEFFNDVVDDLLEDRLKAYMTVKKILYLHLQVFGFVADKVYAIGYIWAFNFLLHGPTYCMIEHKAV